MKTKSPLFRSIAGLMALLVFAALPNSILANPCGVPCDPYCELYYGTGNNLYLEVETESPENATIFYTKTLNQPNNNPPCHTNGTPCTGVGYTTYSCANGTLLPVPYGSTMYINALAWRSDLGSSGVTSCEQHNPNW